MVTRPAAGLAAIKGLRLLAVLALAGSGSSAHAAPKCETRVEIEPRRAYVGQPIEHRHIVVRAEGVEVTWTQPLRFPGFRSETLEPASATRTVRTGTPAIPLIRVETPTVLFAVRPGQIELPPGRLGCGEHEIEVASPHVEVLPWPADRPHGFTGVVGAVTLDVASEPSVALGGSVRVRVISRGAANLWDAEPALRVDPPDTEIFARPPRIARRGGKGPGSVRHDVFDLVPRRAGLLRVEPLRIPYLDPADGRYRVAESQPLEIRVLPGAAPTAVDEPGRAPRAEPTRATEPSTGSIWPWAALALLLAVAGAAVVRQRLAAPVDAFDAAVREADRAADPDSQSAALERALRARLAARGSRPPGSGTHTSLEDSPDEITRECEAALEELERARFGGSGPGPEFDARLAAIRALLARARIH